MVSDRILEKIAAYELAVVEIRELGHPCCDAWLTALRENVGQSIHSARLTAEERTKVDDFKDGIGSNVLSVYFSEMARVVFQEVAKANN